jgi:hypothetical protein
VEVYNWLTDSGEVVSSTHTAGSTKHSLSKPSGLVRPEGFGRLIKFNYLIGSRTRGLPPGSIEPQLLSYHVTLSKMEGDRNWDDAYSPVQEHNRFVVV